MAEWKYAVLLLCLALAVWPTVSQNVTIGFRETEYSVVENLNATVEVCVSLTGTLGENDTVVVSVSTMNGTAVAGSDYGYLTMNLTFDNTDMSDQCVDVTIVDDSILEDNMETFSLMLFSDDNVELAPNVTTVTITDDDTISVNFTTSSSNVTEGDVFMVCVSIVMGTLGRDITLMVAASGDADSTDFTGLMDIILLSGDTTFIKRCINISVTMDTTLEMDETLIFTITTSNNAVIIINNATMVTITNDDRVTISLDSYPRREVMESVGYFMIYANLYPATMRPVNFNIVTSDGTATGGMDHTNINSTFTSLMTVICFNVSITDDSTLEMNENFTVTLTSSDTDVDVVNNTVNVIILSDSNDVVNISIPTSLNVLEEIGIVEVCVILTGTLEREVLVDFMTVDGNAISGIDFTSVNITLTFTSGGDSMMCQNITITDDNLLEDDETFIVMVTSEDSAVVFTNNRTIVTIISDDEVTLGFSNMVTTISEGEIEMKCVSVMNGVNGGVGRTITVDITENPPRTRVSLSSDTLIFTEGGDMICFNISVSGDDILEEDYIYSISLSSSDSGVTFNPDTCNITIVDTTTVTIGLETDMVNVVEGNSVNVCVSVRDPSILARNTSIYFVTMTNSATTPDNYDAVMVILVLGPDNDRQCVPIDTNVDGVVNDPRSFYVNIMTNESDRVDLNFSMTRINIDEADSVVIGMDQTTLTVIEGESINVCVNLTQGRLGRDVTVKVTTPNTGQATGGVDGVADYENVAENLIFGADRTFLCVEIMTFSDSANENQENFFAVLSTLESSEIVMLNPNTSAITIIDAPYVTIHPVDQFVLIGDDVMFMINATGFSLSFRWFFNNIELLISSRILNVTNPMLTISNVSSEDFGSYFCRVSNSVTNVTSRSAQLGRLVPPMFVDPPEDQGALEGSNITLNCSATSLDDNVTITWSATDSEGTSLSIPVPNASTIGNVTTSFLDLTSVSDTLTYTCTATNRLASVSTSFNLSVITINGVENVLVTIGLDTSLYCNASGHPDLTYAWERVDPPIIYDLSSRISGLDMSRLTFLNVSSNDASSYRCTVSLFNDVIGTAIGNLTTRGPYIIESPMNMTLVTGNDTLILNCTAVNNADAPNPLRFVWVVNGMHMFDIDPMGRLVASNTYQSQLIIETVSRSNDASYFCLVHNRALEDSVMSEVAIVDIQFPPVVSLTANSNELDPNGVIIQTSFNVTVGRNDTIVCVVVAFPLPSSTELTSTLNGTRTVLLTQDNGTLTTPEVLSPEIKLKLVLRLDVQSLDDNGIIYECISTNDIGTSRAEIVEVVQDIPGPIDQNEVTTVVVDLLRVNITFPLPIDNNSPIQAYLLSHCYSNIQLNGTCITPTETMMISVDDVATRDGSVTIIVKLPVNSMIESNITAENTIGRGVALNGPFVYNTATPMDARPVNVATVLVTDSAVVLSWILPVSTDIIVDICNVTLSPAGDMRVESRIVNGDSSSSDIYGVTVSGLTTPSVVHNVYIICIYSNPIITSVATHFSFTTLTMEQAASPLVNESVQVPGSITATTTAIRWTLPQNTQFLTLIVITITSTPISVTNRRKRQTNVEVIEVNPTQTQSPIPLVPYSNNEVMVEAEFMPPGSTDAIRSLLVNPTNILSLQGVASAPTGVVGTALEYNNLIVTWILPSTPNGIIIDHLVFYEGPGISIQSTRTSSSSNTVILSGLEANTRYTIRVQSFNGGGGGGGGNISENGFGMTGAGASPPSVQVIPGGGVPGVYTILITFNLMFGPLDYYQVIVNRRGDTSTSNIQPFPSDPYVAFQDDFSREMLTFPLGNDVSTVHRGTTFSNPPLNAGTDYFIFVRVFSSLNPTFNDSFIPGITRFSPSLDPVVIIAPIAAIAVILLIVLVVLLLVAYLTMHGPPRGGRRSTYSPGLLEDGKRRNKKGGGTSVELRRTRLFSPVLNVGSPDVFTSAGQPSTLICEASGTPAPEVAWTRNDEPLDKERFIQLADGSLFINDTDLQDEGTYVVCATNSAGEAESAVRVTVLRPIPPELDSEHPDIQVGEFSQKIALIRAEDDEGLEDEYSEVELDWTFSSYTAKLNINKNKNRYINIIPYDHSRVVLSLQENTPGSDYINASFVDAYQYPNGYIASQGPIPSTFPDFWRMIWELDVPTIVMVTNLKEEDKVKCHQYWPSYGTTTYGNIQVTLKEVENLAEYSIRTFNVSPLAGQSRVQMPVREVRQFHFLVWPDHGVPLYATNLLSFRKRILNYHPLKRGPMCVHCSAGVGRTGTFITIDYMLKRIEAEGVINIFNFVRHMRYRRNYMVQTSPQYVFIHDALLEAIMCGDNSIKAPEVRSKVKEMMEVVPDTGKTPFQTQFATLISASPPDDDFDSSIAQLPDNMTKNSGKEHLPGNDYRVVLSTEGDQSDYICASYVDNYRERNAFIVTQAPMTNTTGDFWRMIWETKSAAIVMLTELTEEDQELCVKYWPSSGVGEASVFGNYQVELSEDEKERGSYITRRFKLSPLDKPQESRMVSQFHFTRWTRTTPPSDCRPMIDLIDELQRVQRKSGNMPITVHCSDGICRTGAFCALYSVLERVKTEQIVDVFQAVKTLRIQRAGLLGTIEEYEFVHRAVIEFLDTFSDYQNFK